jgi:hypothetical protein
MVRSERKGVNVLLAAAVALSALFPGAARSEERSLSLRPPVSEERFEVARNPIGDAPPLRTSSFAEGWSPRKKWVVGGLAALAVIGIVVLISNSGGDGGGGGGGSY